MNRTLIALILTFTSINLCCSTGPNHRIRIAQDLVAIQISEHAYVHVSYVDVAAGGGYPSNGLIYTSGGEAILFDTPPNDSLTKSLVNWITESLKARLVGFVPNHWHVDCMGGLSYLHSIGIPSYAQENTVAIAKSRKLPIPLHPFVDSLILRVGKEIVVCRYFGAAHTVDNIVAWIPSEKVLFGGCMVKELNTWALGNTVDADLSSWPTTIGRVVDAYPSVRIVIPGHGEIGGSELLVHTQALFTKRD